MKNKFFNTKAITLFVSIAIIFCSVTVLNPVSAQNSDLTIAYPATTANPTTEATSEPNKYTPENPLKILCLGDSITHGSGVADEATAKRYHTSYRYPLWKKFIDNNYHVEFVGNRNMNFNQDCTEVGSEYKGHIFNNKHEAHYGITLYDIIHGYMPTSANESKAVPPLSEEISNLDFDAVIINLGTNTRTEGDTVYETNKIKADEMREVIKILREKNPNVIIYITQLLCLDTYDELNTYYQEIADTMSTNASPIICIRTKNPRWDSGDYYLSYIDGVHPDAHGDDYLSEIILNSMRPLLDGKENIKNIAEPFKIFPVEKPIKPKKVKLITKKITRKTKVIKGKTNVKEAYVTIKVSKKTIKEVLTNKKGIFKAKVKLKKYKPGTKMTFRVIKYYEAYDYTEIIKKSPTLTIKIKKK